MKKWHVTMLTDPLKVSQPMLALALGTSGACADIAAKLPINAEGLTIDIKLGLEQVTLRLSREPQ